MKIVILAGGLGTRISEESHLKPKPMIEIGEQPILWHIMKYYSSFGYTEFIICCGYKQYVIKKYFADYYLHMSDITFDFSNENKMIIHNNLAEPWKVTLIDTGINTMTGGRIKRVSNYIDDDKFMLTYGDGVADIDINALVRYHDVNGKKATLTAIQPGGRYGKLDVGNNNIVKGFKEKALDDGGWVNGGFMVLSKDVLNYINGDDTIFEQEPLETLAAEGELAAFKHFGFWQCMDTLRDKEKLERMWNSGDAPWKVWN
jgi:glucose-1-phosphate cytidylyltransferase